jgi:quinol monooxygenase YgiN
MNQYHAQHAKCTTKSGKRDELIQQLIENIEPLKHASGCIYYVIGTTEEPDVVWISELWASKEAKDAFALNPESAKVIEKLMPLVAAMTERTAMTIVGGIGIQ